MLELYHNVSSVRAQKVPIAQSQNSARLIRRRSIRYRFNWMISKPLKIRDVLIKSEVKEFSLLPIICILRADDPDQPDEAVLGSTRSGSRRSGLLLARQLRQSTKALAHRDKCELRNVNL